jgi:hypothetical protein
MMTDLNDFNNLLYKNYKGTEADLFKDPDTWRINNHNMLIMNTFRGLPFILSIPVIKESLGFDYAKLMTQKETCLLYIQNSLRGSQNYLEAFNKFQESQDQIKLLQDIEFTGMKIQKSHYINKEVNEALDNVKESPIRLAPHLVFDCLLENTFQKPE